MVSLRATTGATVYAVVHDGDDSGAAWAAAGAVVLTAPGPTFAVKVNHAYRVTTEPWLFMVGDDVRFRSGWLRNARLVADPRTHVVGTNDRGTPRVVAGEHGTHLLIRRAYVDIVGASWDGPGVVCHEGYAHWFVDDEIVSAAKLRGVWASARSSVVEHLHPMFGRADMDDTYRVGQASAFADEALYKSRLLQQSGVVA